MTHDRRVPRRVKPPPAPPATPLWPFLGVAAGVVAIVFIAIALLVLDHQPIPVPKPHAETPIAVPVPPAPAKPVFEVWVASFNGQTADERCAEIQRDMPDVSVLCHIVPVREETPAEEPTQSDIEPVPVLPPAPAAKPPARLTAATILNRRELACVRRSHRQHGCIA